MVIVHVSYLLLINGCGLQPCESEKTIQSHSGATKASPFRRTPCPGPVGPRSVPKWTVVGLRERIPSALAQVGPVELDLGHSPLAELREAVRIPLGISGIRGPSEGRRQPHYSAVWESSQTEGAEPWVLAGPFRFTSSGQNSRITRGEGLRFPAASQFRCWSLRCVHDPKWLRTCCGLPWAPEDKDRQRNLSSNLSASSLCKPLQSTGMNKAVPTYLLVESANPVRRPGFRRPVREPGHPKLLMLLSC